MTIKLLFDDCSFRETLPSESHTHRSGVKKFLFVISLLISDLDEIWYKVLPYNTVERLRVWLKSRQP
jgi:hypothetical protein